MPLDLVQATTMCNSWFIFKSPDVPNSFPAFHSQDLKPPQPLNSWRDTARWKRQNVPPAMTPNSHAEVEPLAARWLTKTPSHPKRVPRIRGSTTPTYHMEGEFWVPVDLTEQIGGEKRRFAEKAGISRHTCEGTWDTRGSFESLINNADLQNYYLLAVFPNSQY